MLLLLKSVGRQQIEAARRCAHPFAVGSVDDDAGYVLVCHKVFADAVLVIENIAARHRRAFALASVLEHPAQVVHHLDALVGAYPQMSLVVLRNAVDIRCLQLRAVVGIDICHLVLAVVDEYLVGAPPKQFQAVDAVPDDVVDIAGAHHILCCEACPFAIAVFYS